MKSEIAARASFDRIRYAQCWEDTEVLLEALNIQPGDVCVSICSAGDNSLSLLTADPGKVVALDLSEVQLFCLEIRVAGMRKLSYEEFLEFCGARPSTRREQLYSRCKGQMSARAQDFWDSDPERIRNGFIKAGKFENFFKIFSTKVMPLIHPPSRFEELCAISDLENRRTFYRQKWANWRWKLMFKIFCSRTVVGKFGRDPEFFKYVDADVSTGIMNRATFALSEQNPAQNPYVQWIFRGEFGHVLPFWLRKTNYDLIVDRLDRIEWRQQSVEEYLDSVEDRSLTRFNLSDIFEYMSEAATEQILRGIAEAGTAGGRVAYWNMLVPRSRPDSLKDRLRPLQELSERLHKRDQAVFYSRFVVEEIL